MIVIWRFQERQTECLEKERRASGGRKGSLRVELAGTTGSACQKVAVAAASLRLVRVARPAAPLRINSDGTSDSRHPSTFLPPPIGCCCVTRTRWAWVSRPHRLPCSGLPMGPTSRLQIRCKPKPSTLRTLLHLLLPQTLLNSSMTKSAANMSRVRLLPGSLPSYLLTPCRQETRFWSIRRCLLRPSRFRSHPTRRYQEDQGRNRSARNRHFTRFPTRNQVPPRAVTPQHHPPNLRLLHQEPEPQSRPRTTAPG